MCLVVILLGNQIDTPFGHYYYPGSTASSGQMGKVLCTYPHREHTHRAVCMLSGVETVGEV